MEDNEFNDLLGSSQQEGRGKQSAFHGGSQYLDRLNNSFAMLHHAKVNFINSKSMKPLLFENKLGIYRVLRSIFAELSSKMSEEKSKNIAENFDDIFTKLHDFSAEKLLEDIEFKLRRFADGKGLIMADKPFDLEEEK